MGSPADRIGPNAGSGRMFGSRTGLVSGFCPAVLSGCAVRVRAVWKSHHARDSGRPATSPEGETGSIPPNGAGVGRGQVVPDAFGAVRAVRVQRHVRPRFDVHSGSAQRAHRAAVARRAVGGGVLVLVEGRVDPPDRRHGAPDPWEVPGRRGASGHRDAADPRDAVGPCAVVARGASSHVEDREAATRWATVLQSGQVSHSHAASVGSGTTTVDSHSVVTERPGSGRSSVAWRLPSAGRQKKGCITPPEKSSRKMY